MNNDTKVMCNGCGKYFKNDKGVNVHKRSCKAKVELIQIEEKNHIINRMDSETKNIIIQINNLLYSKGITGEKAMNDIIRLIFLRINTKYLTELGERIKNTEEYQFWLDEFNVSKDSYKLLNWEYLSKIILEFKGLKALINDDNTKSTFIKEIGLMLKSDNFTKKFFRTENWINISDNITLSKIITLINKLNVDSFKENDTNGSIYEYIVNDYLGGGKLGQFFTPRTLVESLITEVKKFTYLELKDDIKIYDPCMGTAGFLQRLKMHYPKNHITIYGSEIEPDTLMYGLMNLLIYNEVVDINVVCEDSLFAYKDNKFDIIITNPPFGITVDIEECEKHSCFIHNNELICKDSSGIFALKCGSMLSEYGVCAIVLPYGGLITSESFNQWRRYIMANYDVKKIIYNEVGIFEHTNIPTINLIFTTGTTKSIEFNSKDEIIHVKISKLLRVNSWNIKKYRKSTFKQLDTLNYVKLKTIGMFEKNYHRLASFGNKIGGTYQFFSSSMVARYCEEFDYDGEYIIIGRGGKANVNYSNGKFSCSNDCSVLSFPNNNTKYIYYYLIHNISRIEDMFEGVGIKHINKDNINNFKIVLPSIIEQDEIVKQIDSDKDMIKSFNDNIATYNQKIKDYMKNKLE